MKKLNMKSIYKLTTVCGFFAIALFAFAGSASAATTNVADLPQLTAALASTTVDTINITADITATPQTVVVDRTVIINGAGHTLSFTGLESAPSSADDGLTIIAPATVNDLVVDSGLVDPTAWVGTYAVHVYNSSATLNNVTATNGNGGILVKDSTVTLTGTTTLSGNGFGGIESSNGSVLDVSGATFVNDSEAYGLPTLWEDGTTGSTVVGFSGTTNTTIKPTQVQYYLDAGNAAKNVIVTDQTTLLAELADVNTSIITIGNDFTVTEKINITRPVTIDGGNFTISMTGNDPLVWNTATAYVFQVYGTTDVVIKDIKLTHGNAALLINASTATLLGAINVSGNGFGGIESSNGSVLDVSGATFVNDSEAYGLPTLWEDGTTGTTVTNYATDFIRITKGTQFQYYLDPTNSDAMAPVITLLGATPLSIAYGSTYTDAGATALDDVDGVITSSIVTVNPVNTLLADTYTVTYNVSDTAGNPAVQVTRVVTVEQRHGRSGSRAHRATPAIPAVPGVSPAIPAIPSANSIGLVLGASIDNSANAEQIRVLKLQLISLIQQLIEKLQAQLDAQ